MQVVNLAVLPIVEAEWLAAGHEPVPFAPGNRLVVIQSAAFPWLQLACDAIAGHKKSAFEQRFDNHRAALE